MNFTKNVLN